MMQHSKANEKEINRMYNLFKPLFWLNDPVFQGMENIPDKGPVLFVGNHTLLGLWDASLMWFTLYKKKHIYTYSLGDRMHFEIPYWRELAGNFGMVEGSRDNCRQLMKNNQYILVFPGGAREAFKNKGEEYQLIWKNRLGFVKMAVENQCTIVPFSAIGGEECYELVWDSKEIQNSPLGTLLRHIGIRKDMVVPLVKGVGLTPLPKPQRFYYKFGEPISTDHLKGMEGDENSLNDLKSQVKEAVEAGMADLLSFRDSDPNRNLFNRIMNQVFNTSN